MLRESVIEFKTLAEAELCRYCEITFIRGVPMFMVIVGRLIHEFKNPMNNETWEAV